MRHVKWWAWALCIAPVCVVTAIIAGAFYAVYGFFVEADECARFLWRNLGPNCMRRNDA